MARSLPQAPHKGTPRGRRRSHSPKAECAAARPRTGVQPPGAMTTDLRNGSRQETRPSTLPASRCCTPPHQVRSTRNVRCRVCVRCVVCPEITASTQHPDLSSAYLAASHKQKEKYPYPIKALRAGGGNTEYGVCMHMHTRDSRDTVKYKRLKPCIDIVYRRLKSQNTLNSHLYISYQLL